MNPRIHVEHTVTEDVTNIDLVSAQMRIAEGEKLADIGITQDEISVNGTAIQCRITTEDPANEFRPDTGRIAVYRSPGGAGVRLAGATAHAGAEITGHFDSMLAKLTCRGRNFQVAAPAPRALSPNSAFGAFVPIFRSSKKSWPMSSLWPGKFRRPSSMSGPNCCTCARAKTAAPNCCALSLMCRLISPMGNVPTWIGPLSASRR